MQFLFIFSEKCRDTRLSLQFRHAVRLIIVDVEFDFSRLESLHGKAGDIVFLEYPLYSSESLVFI